ncbi:MAG: phosphoadenosine phosphosulfate reductase family protein [Candidatus Gastranaerophilales bacterium]
MGNKTKKQGQMLDCHANARNDEPSSNFAVGKMAGRDDSPDTTGEKTHHILSLSGGKDSTALAFFMKENNPEIFEQMELVFCDTEVDLPETYDYLNKIEVFLNKKIRVIKTDKGFEHMFSIYKNLPAPHRRWCTIEMKTKPFSKYLLELLGRHKNTVINLYVGIRADEAHRAKPEDYQGNNIKQLYPFIENSVDKTDVANILERAGIGFPKYYEWSGRSGCYFCFYQPKISWVRLYEKHPDLFKKAMSYEIDDGINRIGWNMDMLLRELIQPENIKKIKENHAKLEVKKKQTVKSTSKLIVDYI